MDPHSPGDEQRKNLTDEGRLLKMVIRKTFLLQGISSSPLKIVLLAHKNTALDQCGRYSGLSFDTFVDESIGTTAPDGGRFKEFMKHSSLGQHVLVKMDTQEAITGLILGLHPANERRRYFVTMSLIGMAQA